MRLSVIGLAGLFLAAGALAVERRNVFISTDHGISIEAPVSADAAPNLQIAVFFLPPSNNFAANVNVQKQQFTGPIEDYDKLSASQFKQFGLTVLNRTLKGNEARYEYKGDVEGKRMRWYARSIKGGDYVYLVTATGLEEQWDRQKLVLIKSVESFVLKQ